MRRKALVVLGMHRSGTSALTRVLNLAGSFLPDNLLPPMPGENDRGFWEPAELVSVDRRALAAAGLPWDSPARIDPTFFTSEPARAAVAELARVFEQDFSGHDLFVIKDPRMCRLVPLVRSALDQCGIEAAFVLILRHPSAVAASLLKRNAMPADYGQILWLRYMLDAERSTRGLPRVVIGFDELMTDWKATIEKIRKTLGIALAGGEKMDEGISGFLEPSLVHHAHPDEEQPTTLIGAAWAALRKLQAEGETAAVCDEIDRVAQVVGNADGVFGTVLAREAKLRLEMEGQTHSAQRKAESLRRENERLKQDVGRLDRDRFELVERLRFLQAMAQAEIEREHLGTA